MFLNLFSKYLSQQTFVLHVLYRRHFFFNFYLFKYVEYDNKE